MESMDVAPPGTIARPPGAPLDTLGAPIFAIRSQAPSDGHLFWSYSLGTQASGADADSWEHWLPHEPAPSSP